MDHHQNNHHHYNQRLKLENQRRERFQQSKLSMVASSVLILLCAASKLVQAQSALFSAAAKLNVPSELQINVNTPTLKIEFAGTVIKPGESLAARAFKNFDLTKSVSWQSQHNSRYTLVLIDLDRKSTGSNATSIYNQYTNLNIPGDSVGSGQVIVAFEPPFIPCNPATKHRLAMLAFQQDQILEMSDIAYLAAISGDPKKREIPKFDVFTSRHRLSLAAANVFQISGETSSLCSSGSTLKPAEVFTSTLTIAMILFQLITLRHH